MTTTKRIQTFVDGCSRRILGIWYPEIISNERLWQRTSDSGGTGHPTETLEMDGSHSLQASRQYYTTILNVESRGEKEKRATRKYVEADVNEMGHGWRQFGEIGSGLECLLESCWQLMLQ